MKYLSILSAILFLVSCNTSKIPVKKDFKIIDLTQQKWQGKGNINGVYYKASFEQTTKGEVQFDSIYVENNWHKAFVEDENPFVVMASITRESTEQEQGQMMPEDISTPGKSKIEIIRPSESTNEFKGKNMLLYRLNGKKRYFELGKFRFIHPN